LIIAGVVGAAALVLLAIYLVGGLTEFLSFGLEFLPFTLLAALAYAGRKNLTAMVFAYITLAMTGVGVIVYSLANLLIGYIADPAKFNELLSGNGQQGTIGRGSLQGIFDPAAGAGLLLGLLLYTVATLVAASMLFRPVRVAMSRLMPIDPDDFVHKIALSILTLIVFANFIPLLVLRGNPPLLNLVSTNGTSVTGTSLSIQPLDPLYQLMWTVPCVFVMAGWPIARGMPALLERLGLMRPTLRQVMFGLGFGVALALAAMFVIDPGINWIWTTLGWQTTNTAAFDQLLGNFIALGPLGAVIIGASAGLGEELQVRGLLQPRLGLLASNLVFTSLHAYQYGLDALVSVFIVGTILGIVRMRSNTSTSAIVHGTYDFFLVMVTVLFPGS
jgi:hypothetical protein